MNLKSFGNGLRGLIKEGLIRGGYYLDSIFDPSAVDRNVDAPLLQSLV